MPNNCEPSELKMEKNNKSSQETCTELVTSCAAEPAHTVKLSVVIPVYNESGNVAILWRELHVTLKSLEMRSEVVWVDDASTDGTFRVLEESIAALPPPAGCSVQLLRLLRNSGQGAALGTGLRAARGELVVIMDGDLQNDPADIPKLLASLTDEVDLVAGWRRRRRDAFITRRLPSIMANWLLRCITGVPIHDLGCGLKLIRASVLRHVPVYGDRHRYLVPLCVADGAVVTEVEVNHRPRQFGKSNYGLSRALQVLLDALNLRLFVRFWKRPLHLFGGLGLPTVGAGALICIYLTYLKVVLHLNIGHRPLLLLGILLIILGVQFLCFGLLAEIMVRMYEERKSRADDPVRMHRYIESDSVS